jgi:hypothetical protein
MALMLRTNILLAMAKDTRGLRLIAIGKVFFQFINYSIVVQLQRSFQKHLSPHKFGVPTHGGCETILFGIKALLDLHLDWILMQVDVENALSNVFRIIIFRKL